MTMPDTDYMLALDRDADYDPQLQTDAARVFFELDTGEFTEVPVDVEEYDKSTDPTRRFG
jgi:hypothetical protein